MDKLAKDEAWEPSWWSPSWFPFAGDHAGQLLVVDEQSGEVIEFMHDDAAQRPRLARRLRLFGRDTWRAFRRSAFASWAQLKDRSPRRD